MHASFVHIGVYIINPHCIRCPIASHAANKLRLNLQSDEGDEDVLSSSVVLGPYLCFCFVFFVYQQSDVLNALCREQEVTGFGVSQAKEERVTSSQVVS